MDRQTLRDWVHRFNGAGPEGLVDRKAPGSQRRLTAEQEAELAALVEAGPDVEADGVVRWRCIDLNELIRRRWGVDYHERTIGKLLARLGFSHISARPRHHRQDADVIETFKKTWPERLEEIARGLSPGTPIEVWFQDEMRLGQKNPRTRRWARRGSRPRTPQDLRTGSVYLFGAICPARATGAAVVMPRADTQAMQHHLDEIARIVQPGAHAVVLLDQAAWHTTQKLRRPANITLSPLPPKSPELNPAENLWQFLRQTYLSNRVFETYQAILDAACEAWNAVIEQPWRISSIGLRQWAHIGQQ